MNDKPITTLDQQKSRRGLLTLAFAGGAAALAALLDRSNGAHAGHDGSNVLHLGENNTAPAGSQTALEVNVNQHAFNFINNNTGEVGGAIRALASGGKPAILGESDRPGVQAVVGSSDGPGFGEAGQAGLGSGTGVEGVSGSGPGVHGESLTGPGVSGESKTFHGEEVITGTGIGVEGVSGSGPGVQGSSQSGNGLEGHSDSGSGVVADSQSGIGVEGHSQSGPGVQGVSTSTDAPGVGVLGRSDFWGSGVIGEGTGPTTFGVFGLGRGEAGGVSGVTESPAAPGVVGTHFSDAESQELGDGVGVLGFSGSGVGVEGVSLSSTLDAEPRELGDGVGVLGRSASGDAVVGHSESGTGVSGGSQTGIGVAGFSVGEELLEKTGVLGFGSTGVFGFRPVDGSGAGASGAAPGSAPGVLAISGTPIPPDPLPKGFWFPEGPSQIEPDGGLALDVVGKARFSTAGGGSVPQGESSVFVANEAVTADSHVTVTLASDPGSRQLHWVERDPGFGFTVHMTFAPPPQRPETGFTYLIVEPGT